MCSTQLLQPVQGKIVMRMLASALRLFASYLKLLIPLLLLSCHPYSASSRPLIRRPRSCINVHFLSDEEPHQAIRLSC